MPSRKVLKGFKSKTTGILVKGSYSCHRGVLIETDLVTVTEQWELPSVFSNTKASHFVARPFIQNSLKLVHICLLNRSLHTVTLKYDLN